MTVDDDESSRRGPANKRERAGGISQVPSATGIRRAAMDWLARREQSRCELEEKLQRRFPDATAAIGPVLDSLEHEGLLSDARFLENFTRSRVRRGYGPRRIAADLRQRGVTGSRGQRGEDTDMTEPEESAAGGMNAETLALIAGGADGSGAIDWLAQAREVRRRRFGDVLPAGPVERNRQMAFLQRRGFPADVCRRACRSNGDDDAD